MGLENKQVEMTEVVQAVAEVGYSVKNIRESNGNVKFTVEVSNGQDK